MSRLRRPAALRSIAALGAAWGLALAVTPKRVLNALDSSIVPGQPLMVGARVLGARHIGQAAALLLRPDLAARWGAGVDGLHATSMLALAALDPKRRRLELVSAGVSLTLGVASFASRPR